VVALEEDRELFDLAIPDVLHDPVVGHRGLRTERGTGKVFGAISFMLYNKDRNRGERLHPL
jgi:DNA polymerase II small subunit/DNA polymerase delta subunit B